MNGAPYTRTWMQSELPPTLNEAENSIAWRAHHVQLYTPIMLTRYDGNLFDEDLGV